MIEGAMVVAGGMRALKNQHTSSGMASGAMMNAMDSVRRPTGTNLHVHAFTLDCFKKIKSRDKGTGRKGAKC
jgi:hypothetical protein